MSDGGQIDLDKDRVTVLLLINSLLIKKAHDIYVTILSNRLTIQQMPPQSRHSILEQYNNINRRLQCNLSVLSYLENLYNSKVPSPQPNRIEFPVILSPPPEMPELRLLYKRLQELYPEAIEFLKMKMHQMKMHQMKQQQESQIKPLNMPQLPQNTPNPQISQVPQQHIQTSQTNSQEMHHPNQQQDTLHTNQRQQFTNQGFPPYNLSQSETPVQYQSSQLNMPQSRKHPQANITSKIAVQHHLPQHHSKHLDIPFTGGISPQMMSKEPEAPTYNDPASLLNAQNGIHKNVQNMLSISPQQILQQQMPPNDLSMDFL